MKPMRYRLLLILLAIVPALYSTYWIVTELAIRYCVYDISQPHGCVRFLIDSGDETRFLLKMGRRSIPAVRRQLEQSGDSSIHFAWILSSLGDHSHFRAFIEGLHSPKEMTRYMAVARMCDFPDECRRHLPEFLEAGTRNQHPSYWFLLEKLVRQTKQDENRKSAICEVVLDHQVDKYKPLTKEEVKLFSLYFEAR